MVNLSLGIFFLQIIIITCQSPCPKYFRYYRDVVNNEIMGIVEIHSSPKGVPLMLRVTLSVPVPLSEKYLGRIELLKSQKESVQAIYQGNSLFYKIKFPLQVPLPLLTEIALNNKQICIGPQAIGPIASFVYLEHILYPPGIIRMPNFQNSNQIPNQSRPPEVLNSTRVIPIPKTDFRPNFSKSNYTSYLELNGNCGITKNLNPLVARGKIMHPGDWPWLVAIYFVKIDLEYQCIGNLVSRRHIITAAHCLQMYEMNVPANNIVVSLGRHSRDDWDQSGILNREVLEVRIHPDFNNLTSADADLAVLVLSKTVDFTSEIRPICLWGGPRKLEKIVGETGYVVGWGSVDEERIFEGEPRITATLIVSQEDCLHSNDAYIEMISKRTFCARNRNGTGPSNGDSGSGFAILDPETGRYHLRGIASLSLLDRKTMSCDSKEYTVYVDLAQHHDWIIKQISSDLA